MGRSQRTSDGYLKLDDALQANANKGLKKAFEYYRMSTEGVDFRYKLNQPRRGDYAKSYNRTDLRYESDLRLFYKFCAETGEYESMMLLLFPKRTDESLKCPAMSVKAICNFMRYKKNPNDTPLLDGNNDICEPVLHVLTKDQIKSKGKGWLSNKVMGIFGSAIGNIHRVHLHSGDYMEGCSACGLNRENNGCEKHRFGRIANWIRQGNPTKDNDYKTNMATLKDPNYVPNGCSHVDPGDIRDMRDFLLKSNTLSGLKMLVMILISVKLFFRADEIVTLTVESFIPELFFRMFAKIYAVGLQVTGKSEQGEMLYYNLWRDWEYPDLCPLIHLLIYIHAAGIKGGFIFPSDVDLNSSETGADGVYVKNEAYKTFLNAFKRIADTTMVEYMEDKNFKIGLHIFKKGAYTFRIYAYKKGENVDYIMIKFDARHKKDEDAQLYIRDALQHNQYQNICKDPRLCVSDKRTVRIQDVGHAKKTMRNNSNATHLTLLQLAEEFVKGLPCRQDASPKELVDAAVKKTHGEAEISRMRLEESLSDQQRGWYDQKEMKDHQNLLATIEQVKQVENKKKRPLSPKETETARPSKTAKSKTSEDVSGKNNLDQRKGFTRLTTCQKIDCLLEIEKDCPEEDTLSKDKYTPSTKKWVHTTMRPMLKCYRNHCSSSQGTFAERWKTCKSDFSGNCCMGTKDQSCPTKRSKQQSK
jgi:hypothetical protein